MTLGKNKILILFSLVYIFLAVALILQVPNEMSFQDQDSRAYCGNGFLFYRDTTFSAQHSMPHYTLGYPIFIGIVYKLFGVNNFPVVILQLLMALLSGFLIYSIAKRFFNETVANLAFVFFSFNLGYLVFPLLLLTDMLLAFLLLLAFERLTAFFAFGKIFVLAQSAFFYGLSIAVKPAALYFVPFLAVVLFFFCREQRLIKALIFLSCFYAPVLLYMSFNKVVFNEFKISKLSNDHIFYTLYPKVLALNNGTSVDYEFHKMAGIGLNEVRQECCALAKKRPILFAYVWLQNVAKSLFGLFTSNLKVLVDKSAYRTNLSFLSQSGDWVQKVHGYITAATHKKWVWAVGYFELFGTLFKYFFVLIGFFYLLMNRKYFLFFLFASYLFYFSMITGFDGCSRYRMMFEFVLIILAALGMCSLIDKFYKRKTTINWP